ACQRIAEDVPAGTISLRGDFVKQHSDELCGLIRNTEEMEKSQHPLERLMAISDDADGLTVTTTGLHLAQRIGHALEAAYDGAVKSHDNGEEYYDEVHAARDRAVRPARECQPSARHSSASLQHGGGGTLVPAAWPPATSSPRYPSDR